MKGYPNGLGLLFLSVLSSTAKMASPGVTAPTNQSVLPMLLLIARAIFGITSVSGQRVLFIATWPS